MNRFATVRGALSYANVMATFAIFVALGGSSYAALKVTSKDVRDNSLASRDLRDNSITSRDIRNGSLTAADFKQATGTTQFRVINRGTTTLQLKYVSGGFASTPALGSFLNPGTEQDFSLGSGFGMAQYWALNANQQRIGQVSLPMVPGDPPMWSCAASGETNRDGSSTWDGACSIDGTTATITG
jgi:hypothetical protein